MDYFSRYVSNSVAGSGNQTFFFSQPEEFRVGRILYRVQEAGTLEYAFLFSNVLDSTFQKGEVGRCNLPGDAWMLYEARVAVCKGLPEKELALMTMADREDGSDIVPHGFQALTFGGKTEKEVAPGEFFHSDPVVITLNADEYLCLEIRFSGTKIPHHKETLLPVFVKTKNGWLYSSEMPFPGMIGCRRNVKKRIAFFGDSITQGIGAGYNTYLHWNALLAKKLGSEYSYWNLGIGSAKCWDAASDGAWIYKAKQNDIVFVCFGVNDIRKGSPAEKVISDLETTVRLLKKEGIRIILQTVPPFRYNEEQIPVWYQVNQYILEELSKKVDATFDVALILGKKDTPYLAAYGAHPNAEGSALWAEALYEAIRDLF